MTDLTKERMRVFSFGLAMAAAGAVVRLLMYRVAGSRVPFMPFFPAVIVAALWGGTRAGIAAAIGSLLLAPFWMTGGYDPLNRIEWTNIATFAVTCAIIVWAIRQGHWARRKTVELGTKLSESEARFRQMADSIPQLAWMARADGWIFWYNRRWYEYTGTTPQQMEGWGWRSVHDPEELPRVLERWRESIATAQPFDMTFPLKGADGVFRPFLTRVMPFLDENGKVALWFGTNTDVSEQRQLIEERQRLLESERAARSAAERANTLKDEFLATVSHELRTPLNAILGWAQLVRLDGTTESVQEGLATIDRNARAQMRIIEDLLEMSRIISGKTRLDVQQTDLRSVIEAALESLRPAAEARSLRIIKRLEPIEPIMGDPARLQQVLWNLVGNAIKFTPKGGQVSVVLHRANSHVEIVVSDNGQGIAPEFLPYIFDRFRQQDTSPSRRSGGLGLGLSIVKSLVELHGGTVNVQSAGLNRGATFTIALPVTPLRSGAPERVHPLAGLSDVCPKGIELQGVRVLVIDDEPDSLQLVRRLLEECKADVLVASSADEGLQILEEKAPDVIVSDIGMPEKDGFEMIRELRAKGDGKAKTPAVALTAFARSEDRTRAMLAGYQMHLAKPVEPQELIAAVANLSGRTG